MKCKRCGDSYLVYRVAEIIIKEEIKSRIKITVTIVYETVDCPLCVVPPIPK